jgi:hypothetical protein
MLLIKKYLPLIIVVIYLILQLPFLTADPETNVEPLMRGAWTDEGLYASQIRNFVDHGNFDLKENTTFLRGPVYNIIQLPFFFAFGTSLLVNRLIVLLITLFVLYLFLREKKFRDFGIFLSLFALLQFRIFHFIHFGMPEMICVDFVLLSLFFFLKIVDQQNEKKKILMTFYSSLFLFLCYATKIQYLYVAAIAPITLFFLSLADSINERKVGWPQYKIFTWSFIFSLGFAAVYYFAWYLPNKDFYDYIMTSETGGRYSNTFKEIRLVAQFNYEHVLWVKELKAFIVHFYIVLAVSILFFIIKRKRTPLSIIALFSIIWVIIEIHKIPGIYIPYRYLISLFFAAGVFVASIYSAVSSHFKIIKIFIFIIAITLGIYNFKFYFDSVKARTYNLTSVNDYMATYDVKNKIVIGPWASSVCWKSKSTTKPVWNKYLNWEDPINKFKPIAIVSEIGETDSDLAYKNQGINLDSISDSCKVFDVWNVKIGVYWVNQKLIN